MTAKRDTILWGLFGGGLIILYLLSSTDWIIKEKKTEVYPVSIIIRDVSDDYYANFRKGVEQAADDYNVDVSFLTLYERGDTRQQMEMASREIRDGAGAVILEPADAVDCMRYLDERTYESPIITVGELLPVRWQAPSLQITVLQAARWGRRFCGKMRRSFRCTFFQRFRSRSRQRILGAA